MENEKKREDETTESINVHIGSTAKDFNPIATIFVNTL